jgi:hypothetical protein
MVRQSVPRELQEAFVLYGTNDISGWNREVFAALHPISVETLVFM